MNKAAQALGRRGGKVTSDAKKAAAKKNGKKGGRPKKKKKHLCNLGAESKRAGCERYPDTSLKKEQT